LYIAVEMKLTLSNPVQYSFLIFPNINYYKLVKIGSTDNLIKGRSRRENVGRPFKERSQIN